MLTHSEAQRLHSSHQKPRIKWRQDGANQQEEISDVLYPGKGGMLSFRLQKEEWVNPFLKALKTICFAESLGGVESFITYVCNKAFPPAEAFCKTNGLQRF